MSELAVITPSYRGDAEIFADLHRSVLEFTPPGTVHHVFVAEPDRPLFAQYEGPRCRIWTDPDLLPRRYVRFGHGHSYLNLRRPWPPVRGWVTQQALKIAAAAQAEADLVLLADSDVVLVRPVRADQFRIDGQWALHREENAITADMRRHVIWHQVARKLFGLPPSPPPPLPDYVAAFNFWEPKVVRAMQERIEQATGRNWLDAFTGQLHISEFILYGVFVDEIYAKDRRPPSHTSACHNSWERTPMDHDGAIAFADKLTPDAVAMMISAQSRTPYDVRQVAIRRCAEVVKAG